MSVLRVSKHAFSLIELLVVIGILGVLIGITVPALRGGRVAASQSRSLSNVRDAASVILESTSANRGQYPFADPGEWLCTGAPGEIGSIRADHWSLRSLWPCLVMDIADWSGNYDSWLAPGSPTSGRNPWEHDSGGGAYTMLLPSYQYSNSFIANPRLWSGTSPADPSLIQSVRENLVASPSLKALMIEHDRPYLHGDEGASIARAVALADGSAALRLDRDAFGAVQNPLRSAPPELYHDTPWGVAGRDF